MTASDYLIEISHLPVEQRGRAYELFALQYLLLLPGIVDGWLWADIPQHFKDRLQCNGNDTGIDGLLQSSTGDFTPFQAKFRTRVEEMTRDKSDIDSAIVRFGIFTRENPTNRCTPIVISVYSEHSHRSDIGRIPGCRWIFRDEQLGYQGDLAVATLKRQPPPPPPITLRPVQCEDLYALANHFNYHVVTSKSLRVLFHAVMGYGKSLCMAEWIRVYHQTNPSHTVVVVAPTLKIVTQHSKTLQDYYVGYDVGHVGHVGYRPMIHTFASDGVYGTPIGTTEESLTNTSAATPRIIITTYSSYAKLRSLSALQPWIKMVLFDEVHRHVHWDTSDTAHWIGFTATPTPRVLEHLTPVVQRKMGWAIENKYLTDYRLNAFVWRGPTDGSSGESSSGSATEDEPETTNVVLWAAMISYLLEQGAVKKLLVVTGNKRDAAGIAAELTKLGVLSYAVTADTPSRLRNSIERDLAASETGVLCNVHIYREGADLPWLDGVFLCINNVTEVDAAQIVGRALRLFAGKSHANVYFPVLVPARDLANVTTTAYQPLIDFMVKLALQDPDVFATGEAWAINVNKRISVLLGPGSRGASHRPDQTPENPTLLTEIRDQLSIETFTRIGEYLKPAFKTTWLNCVVAGILRLAQNDVFTKKHLDRYQHELGAFTNAQGLTHNQTMSRVITVTLEKQHRVVQALGRGVYRIIDRPKLEGLLIGDIPPDFPVPEQ